MSQYSLAYTNTNTHQDVPPKPSRLIGVQVRPIGMLLPEIGIPRRPLCKSVAWSKLLFIASCWEGESVDASCTLSQHCTGPALQLPSPLPPADGKGEVAAALVDGDAVLAVQAEEELDAGGGGRVVVVVLVTETVTVSVSVTVLV